MKKADFVARARAAHGDRYDYSHVPPEFHSHDKVEIGCTKHGWFRQICSRHFANQGCPSCGKEKGRARISAQEWRERLANKWGDKYKIGFIPDFPSNIFKIECECPEHGKFHRPLNILWSGSGCQKCGRSHAAQLRHKSASKWIADFKNKMGDKFDYSLVPPDFMSRDKIPIICKGGHIFESAANNHLSHQSGCPLCSAHSSAGEREIFEIVKKWLPDAQSRIRPDFMNGKELDIYSPAGRLAIEYCGCYWHSEEQGRGRNYHRDKMLSCRAAGVRLITVWDWEWTSRRPQVEDIIKTACGATEGVRKLRADKCRIEQVSVRIARPFYDANHIQGFGKAGTHFALYEGRSRAALAEGPVAMMSFGWNRFQDGAELIRFAVRRGMNIPYAASRLFAAYIRETGCRRIKSYCDLRLFTGGLYRALGFERQQDSAPAYYYFQMGDKFDGLHNRMEFQKHKLPKKLEVFDAAKSEVENMRANGWRRIFDCGCGVWMWQR